MREDRSSTGDTQELMNNRFPKGNGEKRNLS